MKDILEKLNRNKVLKGATAIVILGLLAAACTSGPAVSPDTTDTAAVPTEATPTEIPMSARPDFESMSDDELLQTFEEYRALFTEQIDCKLGAVGLPEAKEPAKLLQYDENGLFWKSELLGIYQAPLSGKDGLPAGYVNCLFFAASNPGEVFTIYGGGELWGEDMLATVNNRAFELSWPTQVHEYVRTEDLMDKLEIGQEYKFSPISNTRGIEMFKSGRERQLKTTKDHAIMTGYACSLMYIIDLVDIQDWVESNVNSNYPFTNTTSLIDNTEKPVLSYNLAPYTEE
jgi:hypothetical protein